MPVKLRFLIFFSIFFLNFFPKNNLIFAHTMSDTTCTCSANDFCSAGTTTQSHCHPYGDDRWSWEGCHFDANSCYCRPNGCGGAPVPTATPTRVPTAIPTVTPRPTNTPTAVGCYQPCTPGTTTCASGLVCADSNEGAGLPLYVCLKSACPGSSNCVCPLSTPTPQPTNTLVPTIPPATPCQVTSVSASDGQYADRVYISWTVANGDEAQRIDVYQGDNYLTSKSNTDSGQWNFTHQNLTCPVTNIYHIFCWKNNNLYGRGSDTGGTLCSVPTSTPRLSPTPTLRLPTLTLTPTSIRPTPTPTLILPTSTPRPTIPPLAYRAWFQSQDGDVHAQGNITDPMSPFPAKIFSLDGEGRFPGVVSFWGTSFFGSGAISSTEWLAKTRFVLRNFNFYYTFLGSPQTNPFNGGMPGGDSVYFADSDQIIASDWNLSGGKRIIILVNGNVRILGNIVVPYGSSLVLITSGNISFGNNVSQAQGIFLADKKISTGTGPVAFEGEGSFVAGQEIILGRDFGDTRNRFTPVEKFIFRPDLLINGLSDIWSFGHVWEELAP